MFETAKPFLLSLALGLLVGIERERSFTGAKHHAPFGARTFTLIALMGTLAAHLAIPALTLGLTAFIAGLTIAAYARPTPGEQRDPGTTTEVAAVLTFGVGYLAYGEARLAAMLGVIVVGVLWLKPRIHAFADEALSDREVNAALTFLVIALVVLPLLPNHPVDPWGIANPATLWLLFVLIAGVGFAGYIAVRALGPSRGLALAGFFAGLVSSTAATFSLSRRAKSEPALAGPLATGIVLANVASAAAQLLIVAVADPALLPDAGIVIGAPIAVGAIGAVVAAWIFSRRHDAGSEAGLGLSNPLELKPAFVMASMFALVLVASAVADHVFGSYGLRVTAAIAGTNDVHAATLAAATLSAAGSIVRHEALLAMLIAFTVNMIVKISIAGFTGGRRLLLIVGPPLAGMAAAALAAFLLV